MQKKNLFTDSSVNDDNQAKSHLKATVSSTEKTKGSLANAIGLEVSKKHKKEMVTIYLPEHIAKFVKQVKKETGLSVTKVCEEIMTKFIEQHAPEYLQK